MGGPVSGASEGLYHGDCLDMLAALPPERRFDLAYLDPPFATQTTFGARQERGERSRGEAAYRDVFASVEAWAQLMRPRLVAVAERLSPRSSLWLHLDHRVVHDAKCLCDTLFGRAAFRGEVIWVPGNGARGGHGPRVTHQTLLIYAPHGDLIWNREHPSLREPYAEISQRRHFQNVDAEGRRYRERVIRGKAYRYFADVGRVRSSVWDDCPAMSANTPKSRETTGYPTQKPEKLLERILHAATSEGSWVLDPMCGSGTTLAVARRLGRRFLGIDSSPVAARVAGERLGLPAEIIDPAPP